MVSLRTVPCDLHGVTPVVIPQHILRMIESYTSTGMVQHAEQLLFKCRCDHAVAQGFIKHPLADFVKMIMDQPHNQTVEPNKSSISVYDWVYDHHTDQEVTSPNCCWVYVPQIFSRSTKKLFSREWKEDWRCRLDTLDRFKNHVPISILLRMNEIRSLKIFNAFSVLFPETTKKEPIILAEIWNWVGEREIMDRAYFFMSQWKAA